MIVKFLLFSLLIAGNASLYATTYQNRLYTCLRVPKLDAARNRNWTDVPASGDFFIYRTEKAAAKKTSFKAVWTPEALYVMVHCPEPGLAKLKTKEPDNGKLWEDDSVEIFLDCGMDNEAYCHFIANAAGKRYQALRKDKVKLAAWTAACARNQGAYTLTFKIPFAVLGKAPKPGDVWRFNVCRNDSLSQNARNTSWAFVPPANTFHSPEAFGFLKFAERIDGTEPEITQAQVVENFYKMRYYNRISPLSRFLSGLPAVTDTQELRKMKTELTTMRKMFLETRKTEAIAELGSKLDQLRSRIHLQAGQSFLNSFFPSGN